MRVPLVVFTICAASIVSSALAQPPSTVRAPTPAQRPPTQQPPPATTPAPALPQAPAPRREGQPVNIKVDVTITDQRGTAAAIKRSVSVVVGDGYGGMIRSQSEVAGIGSVPLNIDVEPTILADNKIRVTFNLQYDWPAPVNRNDSSTAGPAAEVDVRRGSVIKTAIRDTVSLILENGKSMIAAQSADPIGDRQVSVEVKATILR